jgi:ubiquinone/menaquinone biosynthesis C-methylase UbiE
VGDVGRSSRVFAWFLDATNGINARTYRRRKAALFADLAGDVVEIGPGAGVNFAQLPAGIRWVGVEPNLALHPILERRAAEAGIAARIVVGTAEETGLPASSADVVLATLVLCSVDDVGRALAEVRRVLRPGGRFVFVEHVAAPAGTWLRRVQRASAPLWRCMADGCHPDRETLREIEAAGFARVDATAFDVPAPVIRPHVAGVALR